VAQMSEVVREYTEIWHGVLFLMGLEHLRGALQDVGVYEHCTIRFVRETSFLQWSKLKDTVHLCSVTFVAWEYTTLCRRGESSPHDCYLQCPLYATALYISTAEA